jgi:hypothetical protein
LPLHFSRNSGNDITFLAAVDGQSAFIPPYDGPSEDLLASLFDGLESELLLFESEVLILLEFDDDSSEFDESESPD